MDRIGCMIYGANGFTGRLVAEEAIRQGLRPVLAGRRAMPIEALATELRLPAKIFDLADRGAARAALSDVAVVANCAGPFSATSGPVIDACLAARRHYLDITGEIDVFIAAQSRNAEARSAGIVICPGVGFDVVPTDCLAAVLKEALPDATHLALGFDVAGVPSAGTARTAVEGLAKGGRVRKNGEIVSVPLGHRRRMIDFGRGETRAVTVPWGDIATAYVSTGIPEIEVYVPAPPASLVVLRLLDFARPMLATAPVQSLLRSWASRAAGPSEERLQGERAYVWGEVRNAAGTVRTARITTPNGYRFTASSTVMAIMHVLGREPSSGYLTPSQLMGSRCVEQVDGVTPITIN